jgi:hypothetical protein
MTEPVVHIIKAETVHIGHIQTNTSVEVAVEVETVEAHLQVVMVAEDLVKVPPTEMQVQMVLVVAVAAVHLGEIILGIGVVEVVAVALLSHILLHTAKYFQVVRNLYRVTTIFISLHLLVAVNS